MSTADKLIRSPGEPEGAVQPASQPPKSAEPKPSLMQRTFAFISRSLTTLAGLGLLIGFFLPWIKLGDMIEVSGLSLVVSSGSAVEQLSGPHRFLLFGVPLAALAMLVTGIRGTRGMTLVALLGGLLILAYGFYTLVWLFFDSTGIGMWLVIGSALLALCIGLVSYGNRLRNS